MTLSDLLVPYRQVSVPSFLQIPDIKPTTIDVNFDRVKSLDLDSPKFLGFTSQEPIQNYMDTPYSSNDIVQYFMDKGLTKNQAKGIYGNLMQESSGNLNARSSDGYNSYGLAQWTGNRKLRLFSKYGNHPTKQQQLDFLWEELNTTEKNALDALLKTKTVDDATEVFMRKFERPAAYAANLKARLRYAHSV